jgi:phenylpropionate dioxygenase-like ring-hydroxylating dioxygenase large terminal subunit
VTLLGETLIAFRDTNGKVGLVDNYCPHRRASLFFGRNEECGLRCVYHGWKFDVNGDCVDMPSEPAESNFKDKVKITAYPCDEKGDIVWAFMGPADKMAELPHMEWMDVPAENRKIAKLVYECNYIQAIEGEIDTTHAAILHSRLDSEEKAATATTLGGKYQYKDKAARFFVSEKEHGLLIGARREAEEDSYYWRISRWLYPFYSMIPREPHGTTRLGIWYPMDNENTWVILVLWHKDRAPTDNESREIYACRDLIPGTWYPKQNLSNDYMIDREIQKHETYTGIPTDSGRAQDSAMMETMGKLIDRTHEHLGTSDTAIIAMRKTLTKAVYKVRSGGALLPRDVFFSDDKEVLDDITVA